MRTLLLIAALALVGCRADKRLWIESDPPGAEVRLDHVFLGTTPHEMEFTHYGTHRLSLTLDGFEAYTRDLLVPAPWYARFPIDIFSEVLFPIGWEDHKVARATLRAQTKRIDAEVLKRVQARAQIFRDAVDSIPDDLPVADEQTATPLVAVPR